MISRRGRKARRGLFQCLIKRQMESIYLYAHNVLCSKFLNLFIAVFEYKQYYKSKHISKLCGLRALCANQIYFLQVSLV